MTPFFVSHLLFGPVTGMYLEFVFNLAVSWIGGYLLARVLGLKSIACLTCASLFPASSWLYLRLAVGHPTFIPALYFPWVALFAYLSMIQKRLILASLSGLVVALMFGEGAIYSVSHALLLVAILAVSLAVARRDAWPLVALGMVCVSTVVFASPKLIPSYMLLRSYPRFIGGEEANSISTLLAALLSSNQDCFRPKVGFYGFWEYGAYVGGFWVTLAGVGLSTTFRRSFPWLVLAASSFALAMGDAGPHFPWPLLHQLPVFSSQRVPSRFLILFVFALGVVAAHGADWLERHGKPGKLVAFALLTAAVGNCWLVGPPNLDNMFNAPQEEVPASPSFHHVALNYGRMLALSRANLGSRGCYDYRTFSSNVIVPEEPDYRGEEYLLGPGNVRLVEWSPNKLTYDLDTAVPNTMVINQNYFAGWRVSRGAGYTASVGGLIGVHVPAGTQRLTVAYQPPEFFVGSLVTLVGFVVLLLWRRQSTSRDRGELMNTG